MNQEQSRLITPQDAFFKLIKLALGTCDDENVLLDESGWKTVYEMACKQALAGIVIDGVERLPMEQKPSYDVLMPWIGLVAKLEERNKRMNQLTVMVCDKFEDVGMGAVVLKGQGNSIFYPRPFHRTPGDIDLWMMVGRRQVVDYVRQLFPKMEAVYHHMDFPVIKDTGIELHFTPSWMNCWSTNRRLQKYFSKMKQSQWQHKVELPGRIGSVAVPTLDLNRVYLLVHIYRHLFDEGVGLRQLMDYFFVLKQGFTADERTETVSMLKELRMTRFAAAVMYVLQEVFGLEEQYFLLPPSEEYGRKLLREIMLSGNFGKYDERISRSQNESVFHRFCRKVFRNGDFMADYPSEVIWSPLFKMWHYVWRLKNGYLPRKS